METGSKSKKSNVWHMWSIIVLVAALVICGSEKLYAQPDGAALFKQNCSSCHFATSKRSTGPGLEGVTARRSADWLIRWVRNSTELVASGDSQALAIMKEYNNFPMPPQNLKDEEITAIMKYVEQTEVATKEKAKADSLAKATAALQPPVQVKPQFLSSEIKWSLAIIGIIAVLFFYFIRHVNNVMVDSVGHGMPYFDYSEGGKMEKWLANNKPFAIFFALFLILCCLRFIWIFIGYL